MIETASQILPVSFPGFDELWQFRQLLDADRCLRIERLQIVADMAVNVFVIVAVRKITQLPIETLVARICLSARAPAVASPIAKTFHEHFHLHAFHDVNRTTFAKGEMV